jgi:NAD dependent epimerase/dehydratase family enzyme
MLAEAIDDPDLSGAVNMVSPNAATNAEMSDQIGRVLGRPSWLPAPAFALKALFGEGAEPILGGQRVVPGVMQARGYTWRFAELGPALESCLS